jgi:hypothetical protein
MRRGGVCRGMRWASRGSMRTWRWHWCSRSSASPWTGRRCARADRGGACRSGGGRRSTQERAALDWTCWSAAVGPLKAVAHNKDARLLGCRVSPSPLTLVCPGMRSTCVKVTMVLMASASTATAWSRAQPNDPRVADKLNSGSWSRTALDLDSSCGVSQSRRSSAAWYLRMRGELDTTPHSPKQRVMINLRRGGGGGRRVCRAARANVRG